MLPDDTDAEPSASVVYPPHAQRVFRQPPVRGTHTVFSLTQYSVFSNDFYEVGRANPTAGNKAGSGPSNEAARVGLLTAPRTCGPGIGLQCFMLATLERLGGGCRGTAPSLPPPQNVLSSLDNVTEGYKALPNSDLYCTHVRDSHFFNKTQLSSPNNPARAPGMATAAHGFFLNRHRGPAFGSTSLMKGSDGYSLVF